MDTFCRFKKFGVFALLATTALVGCDVSTSSGSESPSAREATAKATGGLPFGTKFTWWGSHNYNYPLRSSNFDVAVAFNNEAVGTTAVYRDLIKQLDSLPNKNVKPGMYSYLIASNIKREMNATDCNVAESTVVNGVKVRKQTLCQVGAQWLQTNRQRILKEYVQQAQQVTTLLKARKNNTQPFVYLIESDYMQYSDSGHAATGGQTVYLSPEYLGKLMGEITDSVKKYTPGAIVGIYHAYWYHPTIQARYYRALKKDSLDFMWTHTGFKSDTLSDASYKSAITTFRWLRGFTGLPLVIETVPTATSLTSASPAQMVARMSDGVIGCWRPGVPDATQQSFINAVKASATAQALPSSYPALTPYTRVAALKQDNPSLVLDFDSWDRDAVLNPGQIQKTEVYLNNQLFWVVKGSEDPTVSRYSVVLRNAPADVAVSLKLVVTDNEGMKSPALSFTSQAIKIDTSWYSMKFTTINKVNNITFKIPNRTPEKQRVLMIFRDSATGVEVGRSLSDEYDTLTKTNVWKPNWTYAASVPVPAGLKTGTYKVQMLYNDDTLRKYYKLALSLRNSYMRYDATKIYY
jgi:hypothetical protein